MYILVIKNKNECVIPYINKTFKRKNTNNKMIKYLKVRMVFVMFLLYYYKIKGE